MGTLITYLQIFGIGFSFGIAGPCLLACAPVLITYIAGSKKVWREVFKDIVVFLSGRLLAYMLLGTVAGLSGTILRKFISSGFSSYLQPLAGAVTILFAVIILTEWGHSFSSHKTLYENGCPHFCSTIRGKMLNFGGVFVFGFLVGMSPCAPLLALLFDIALMSKGTVDGMIYAFFFGAGTFLSGLITVGVIAGLLTRIPAALVRSKTANIIFKVVCAVLLIVLGLGLMLR